MDRSKVRSFLSQVTPVPFHSDFKHRKLVEDYISALPGYRAYMIYLNGEQLFKPYTTAFSISQSGASKIDSIRLFEVKDDAGSVLAKGWCAQHELLGAIPKKHGIRGLRIRQGNIQIGEENFLADFFTEARFCSWHIGEVHLKLGTIEPNARRDAFVQSQSYEPLLEYFYGLCKHLSKICRESSRVRHSNQRRERIASNLQELLDDIELPLTTQHYEVLKAEIEHQKHY